MQTIAKADCPTCGAVGTVANNRCGSCGASVVRPGESGYESSGLMPKLQVDEDFDPIPVTAHVDALPGDSAAAETHTAGPLSKAILAALLIALVVIAGVQIAQWQSPPSSAFVQTFNDQQLDSQVVKGEPEQTWVVCFWSSRHARCREFVPLFNEVAEALQNNASFAKVRVDQAHEAEKKYEVSLVPSVLMFRGGEIIARTQGFMTTTELKDWLHEKLGN